MNPRVWKIYLFWLGMIGPSLASSHEALLVRPLAETTVNDLPAGELMWRIENFPSSAQATAAKEKWSLVVEAAGKVWLFTLGPAGRHSPDGTLVAEVGPIQRIAAAHYLLRINDASGDPGSTSPIHSHPGSEAYFVLDGEQSIRATNGDMKIAAGHTEPGLGSERAMQVSSTGTVPLHALVMFVVDADKPFSSPATFP